MIHCAHSVYLHIAALFWMFLKIAPNELLSRPVVVCQREGQRDTTEWQRKKPTMSAGVLQPSCRRHTAAA
jgi:hypothetical protein